ncbi:MAG: aminopeptidase P family protein [Clostridia bacterium]|nr:aminopeptidase P family protein [Clostridia bacterium]
MEVSSKIFAGAGADALFIEQDFIRRYLTGFYSTDGYAVVTREGCTFVVDSRYFEAAEKALKNTNIKLVEGLYKQAEALLSGAKTVGVPYPFTNLSRAETLKKNGFALTDCMPALQAAMEIKTSKEIALIEKACEIAEDAYLSLLPEIKEGMTESEVAALLEYKMRKFGASGVSFETIVAFGANGSVPHHETGNTKLKFGDAVLIDFGCKYEGYCSDCTRTFLFGDDKKHEDFKKVYAQVLHAHELVKEKTVAGMTGRDSDEIARGYLRTKGLDKYFTHSLGHGIGLQIHEYPVLAPKSEQVLKDGMVFSDEPGVYLAGELGIRIEDSVYMTGGKVKSFMKKTERNLIIL